LKASIPTTLAPRDPAKRTQGAAISSATSRLEGFRRSWQKRGTVTLLSYRYTG
jgi:hypothetical protein